MNALVRYRRSICGGIMGRGRARDDGKEDSRRRRRRDPVANEGVSLGRTNVDDDECSVLVFNKG